MSELGIIALSILVGAFGLTLVATSVGLVWLMIRVQKTIADLRTLITQTSIDLTQRVNEVNGEDMRRSAEQFGTTVKTMLRCLNRMELAALAIGDMAKALVSESALPATTLPADAYAEPDSEGGRFITQSEAAKRDAQTLEDM